ncbi:aminodeoxychorismate synthase, component I, clade 2 [Nostoc sp. PCC 7524]|uniref:anthranilate synthase component I n=1 Tax=Nostoc sp. (strain ATCC 29411 / PCC 7524) TaxID=28072 RepID=UPI00029F0E0E|nr:anthranilate synthase component I [Nostoc sp. PCC 7524]AFY49250.1 aminodeoxychorismate synthase, component I, clade 2 [Nostoc sp. PCC 7524]
MWYWRSLPLENRTGSEIFSALFHPKTTPGIATLLESPYPTPTNQPQLSRYSICAGAPRIVNGVPQMWTPKLGGVLPFLDNLLQSRGQSSNSPPSPPTPPSPPSPPSPPPPHLPFTGGWLGWLGYDVAWEIEQLPQKKIDPLPFPVAFWYEPDAFAVLDHKKQILWLAASDISDLDELELRLANRDTENSPQYITPAAYHPVTPEFFTSQADYETAVNSAKKYIQAGDIFQANLSLRFAATTSADGWAIYQALHKINPSPFASYWQTPWGEVISCSPERLVMLQNRQAETRPIAGTRSRGITPEQDQQLAQELLSNTKERAEHIMLVDLERNDLGRVCEWGSVIVDELLTIERYSHVMHLVSNVKGNLRSDRTPIDLIRALFPGGTITGCPKVRCMEIIEELEPMRRSLFYGSCGYLDWRGNLDLNIFIRTLLLTTHSELKTVWGQVGAGIVADSDPEKEWYESLHKAQAQLAALKIVK